jgi:broad specificity phosphatase PhoE
MSKLILVKHAPPQITPEVASNRWVLSSEGQARCEWLAGALAGQGVTALYSSLEPKALETAALAGIRLGLEVRPRPGLQENDRTGLGFATADGIRALIRQFFEAPLERVMGEETAAEALERFEGAILKARAETSDQTIAVVAHGTVLTLLVAKHNPISAFEFWGGLGLPSFVVLDGPRLAFDGAVHSFPR